MLKSHLRPTIVPGNVHVNSVVLFCVAASEVPFTQIISLFKVLFLPTTITPASPRLRFIPLLLKVVIDLGEPLCYISKLKFSDELLLRTFGILLEYPFLFFSRNQYPRILFWPIKIQVTTLDQWERETKFPKYLNFAKPIVNITNRLAASIASTQLVYAYQ